jgi:S1-C subfamily serine protease
MGALADVSGNLAEIVEVAGQGVVCVAARRGRSATGIVWAQNRVLTANHAVENDEGIEVATGSATVKAIVGGRDPGTDLVLLRADGLVASPLPRHATPLRVGNLVLALGRPDGIQVTIGVVSALGGSFRSWRGGEHAGLIQSTAELLPGFSGGPLLDAEGGIVGINSWNYGRGISRTLPVETAATVANGLEAHGRIRRAYLGVGTQPLRLAASAAAQAGQDQGLLVVTVDAAGPAGKAGLMQGDVILALDKTPVRELDDLFRALRALEIGTSHSLRLLRAGEVRDLAVTAAERTG